MTFSGTGMRLRDSDSGSFKLADSEPRPAGSDSASRVGFTHQPSFHRDHDRRDRDRDGLIRVHLDGLIRVHLGIPVSFRVTRPLLAVTSRDPGPERHWQRLRRQRRQRRWQRPRPCGGHGSQLDLPFPAAGPTIYFNLLGRSLRQHVPHSLPNSFDTSRCVF